MESLFTFNNIILILFLICLILQAIAFVSLALRYDKRTPDFWHIRNLCIASLLLCIVYYTAMHSISLQVAEIIYPISLIFYNAVIFFFYVYCEVYINGENSAKKKRTFVGIIMSLDAISLIISIFTKHVIYVEQLNIEGAKLFIYKSGPFHIVHYLISVFTLLHIMFLLFREVKRTPFSYGRRYIYIAFNTLIIFAFNLLFHFFGAPADISGIILPYAVVTIYYYTIVFTPSQFLRDSRAKVFDEIKDAILIFDFRGVFRDCNKAAISLFNIDRFNGALVVDNWLTQNNINIFSNEIKDLTDSTLPGSPSLRIFSFPYYDNNKSNTVSGGYIRIHDRTDEIRHSQEELYRSTHDPVTNLINKTAFFEASDNYLKNLPAEKVDHYLICTNIENFKLFNTLFGANMADILLNKLAEGLSKYIEHAILIGRMEADRFCILLPKEYYVEEEFERCFLYALDIMNHEHHIKHPLNVFIGVYHTTDFSEPTPIMYNHALMAVQSIKGSTEEFAAFYDKSITDRIFEEQNLITELRGALANDEFEFFIQPQVSVKDNKVYGGEALVRWNHPKKGILSPFHFIDVMENHGMIPSLDQVIWRKVCTKLKEWKEKGIEQYLSVNISNKDFYFMDICETLNSLAKEYEIDKNKLKLEITESAIMQDEKKQLKLVEDLRNSGFTVEMDDFGSGYSSLSMLNRMQVDVLKLDMGFLRANNDSERSKTIIENITNMAKAIGMSTVAEGVETEDQADFLKSINCDILQGYLFSPPIPVDKYEKEYL